MSATESVASIATEVPQRLKSEQVAIAVLGDLILDISVEGDDGGIHTETGAPLLKNASSHESIGGAGNIAVILSRLGVEATVFSVVGADLPGRQLTETQDRLHVENRAITYRGWPTPRKQWIYQRQGAGAKIIKRVDYDQPLPSAARDRLMGEFRARYSEQTQVLIVADHGLGAIGPETAEAISLAQRSGARVVAIPRTPLAQYKSIDAVVATTKEICALTRLNDPHEAARQYAAANGMIVFLSETDSGLFVCSPADNVEQVVAAAPVDHPQKMGERDMVLAVAALGLALQLPALSIAQLANAFANLVLRQRGNGTVFWSDLFSALQIPEPALQ